ncbi:MAG TPA: N-acetylmuramoyl-L-alanine amidase [Chthoniobacterales bacterium]|nr:N-acetylmuramoyl-L-alanine amidase [Chthoniobacterales bacterium]
MRFAKVILFLLPFFIAQARADDWQVTQVDGRDYVSFENVAQFYRFPKFTRVGNTISLQDAHRRLRAQTGASEFMINGVRFFSDYPLRSSGNQDLVSAIDVAKIIEPVLRPNKIKGAEKIETVVLDPGHGGTDNGASGRWGSEKTYTLAVALTAREQLLRAGFKVEMTRSGDQDVSLDQRIAFANRFTNAVFISIHFNSSNGGAGVESYALAPAGVPSDAASETHVSAEDARWCPGNADDPSNIAIAAAVHAAILSHVSTFDRGVRHARFRVLRDIKIPAVLVEAGFLSDAAESAEIATASYRQKLGRAIAQAVTSYNAAVNFHNAEPAAFAVAPATNLPPHTRPITESLGATPAAHLPAQEPSAVIGGSN